MPHSPLQLLDGLLDEEGMETAAHRFVLGGPFGAEPAETTAERLAHFADAGGLLVETSHSYAGGKAEAAVGEWLRKNPGTLGVTTKIGHDTTGGDLPLSRDTVFEHVRAALANLGVETIDVLLYHCDDPARPVAELADTLVSLVEAGHVRRVGVSNWRAERLAELAAELGEHGHTPVASYQFSLAEPDPALLEGSLHADSAVLDVVRQHRLPLMAWSSQARGHFARTGPKEHNGKPDPYDTEDNRARRHRCRELAAQLSARPETVALAWTLHHPGVWPSIGPRTTAQIDNSLRARRLTLTEEQVRWLRDGR
ncbi:aldo/keto reductase [Streptomyces sp. NBC_00582]|uniref:aldo/keto reductase n=1 Tax=Streptomyces sp. NBC_00582 TaxID=2975783 RepID=UPI0010635468|nr:aldo/keto reductase [Streptomyces sp. NBC_00582]WUB67120.1 aldo/keto reductase [Streptomyces sp. NBC_00582]